MLELAVKLLIAYLSGALLGSLILGALRGVDIRSAGSGNAGATNALRTQGKLFGLSVLVFDVCKGIVAVRWLPSASLPGIPIDAELSRAWLTVACGLAVIIGHVYPVWFGFRGGKGVATAVGVVAAVQLRLVVPLLIAWLIVVMLTGYVGLASMVAALSVVAVVCVLEPSNAPLLTLCLGISLMLIYTHRSNIARMRARVEPRSRRLWLFRSRAL